MYVLIQVEQLPKVPDENNPTNYVGQAPKTCSLVEPRRKTLGSYLLNVVTAMDVCMRLEMR